MLLWLKTDNDIGQEGAGMISEALKINSTLTELNLSGDRKKKRIKKTKRLLDNKDEQVTI